MVNPKSVSLKELSPENAHELHQLVQSNQVFLTGNGDYIDYVALTEDQHRSRLEGTDRPEIDYGIMVDGSLVGVVTLINHSPGVFGLGYWISERNAGKGLTSQAVDMLIRDSQERCGAQEFWAGITPSNQKSIDLVSRLGFELARTQETHLSYRLRIGGGT